MSHKDDISNLFRRFGATSDSYHEFETPFDYPCAAPQKMPLPAEPASLPEVVAQVVENMAAEPQNEQAPFKSLPFSVVTPGAQPVVQSVIPAVEPSRRDIEAPLMSSGDVATPLRHLLAEVALARQAEMHAQLQPDACAPKCKAHVVALVSAKGGVGKSTLGAGLASSLHLGAGKTLAIDLDPQNALHYHLGIESGAVGLGSTCAQGTTWADKLQQGFDDAQLLPYGVLSDDERCALERDMSQDRHWLARQLASLDLGESDVVILDTPTGRSLYLEQALDVADQVIVVTTADAASFIALDQMDRLIDSALTRPESSVCNYVVNQFDARREFSRDMLEVLKRRLGGQLLGVIALDNTLGESLAYGRNPLASPHASAVCQEMALLAKQLKARFQSAAVSAMSAL